MNRGVVYFNYGDKCIERLFVSIYSLKQHYSGPIAVLNVGVVAKGLDESLTDMGVKLIRIEGLPCRALVNKVYSLQFTPFDLNVFIDADTLVCAPIDEFFDALEDSTGREARVPLEEHQYTYEWHRNKQGTVDVVWCHFCGWLTTGKNIKKRMNRWRGKGIVTDQQIDEAIAYGPAVNVGTFAFRKNSPWLKRWLKYTREGGEKKLWIPDEQAAQILLPSTNCRILGPEWGVSVRYGDSVEDKRIIHFHGNKHDKGFPMCNLWREARRKAASAWRFQKFPAPIPKATLVLAVNRPYLELFRKNYATWVNFRDKYPKIIFYNGIDPEEFDFLTGDFRLVEWKMDGVSPKEEMITCFVLGAPKHVQTEFWIKLDVDTVAGPKTKLFDSKCWYNYDLVSHRWGYTKPGKWLVTLEEWADKNIPKTTRVFSDDQLSLAAEQRRFGHQRIQSFACLHRTSFTRWAAGLVAGEGRMPIPSHDTYLWYVAARSGAKIRRVNIRKWGFEHGKKK